MTLASREKPKPSVGIIISARSALPLSFSSCSRAIAYRPGFTLRKVKDTVSAAGTTTLYAFASPRHLGKRPALVVMHARTTPLADRSSVAVTLITAPTGSGRAGALPASSAAAGANRAILQKRRRCRDLSRRPCPRTGSIARNCMCMPRGDADDGWRLSASFPTVNEQARGGTFPTPCDW